MLEGGLLPVTHIANRLLDTSQFCEEWKEALVKPLIKKPSGDLEKKTNYRPVSNIGFISKVIKKVTLLQLTEH